jgi:hypothetical protein
MLMAIPHKKCQAFLGNPLVSLLYLEGYWQPSEKFMKVDWPLLKFTSFSEGCQSVLLRRNRIMLPRSEPEPEPGSRF